MPRLRKSSGQQGKSYSFLVSIPKDKVLAVGWSEGDLITINTLDGDLVLHKVAEGGNTVLKEDKHDG